MTDKTVSSSKSSSKSSSSSLALEKQRQPKVLFTFLSLSLSLSACGWWCENKVDFNKSPQSLAFFFSCVARVWGTNDVAINQRKERTQKAERFERFSHGHMSQRRKWKETTCFAKKGKTKKFLSLFLSLSLQSFVSSVVAFGRRYESYLINLFLLQEERFHDERRREKGKFRV